MSPRKHRVPAALLLAVAALLAGCAANRFSNLPAGIDEETSRMKVGRETERIERAAYSLSLYDYSPAEYYFLKFQSGKLVNKGRFPKWILNGDDPHAPRRPMPIRHAYSLSCLLLKNGLSVEGLDYMRRYISENPDTNGSEVFLGFLYIQADLPDSAIALHRRAIAGAKNDTARASHQNNLLATYGRTRRFDEGEAFALEALSDTTTPTILKPSLHYNLACIYSIQNRKAMAIEQLKRAFDLGAHRWTQAYLDEDKDFDNIRTEPGYLELRSRLKPGKRSKGP